MYPCARCKHMWFNHVGFRGTGSCGKALGLVDYKTIFCDCSCFITMTNLQYLEWKNEEKERFSL